MVSRRSERGDALARGAGCCKAG